MTNTASYIPEIDENFVPNGVYEDVKQIIEQSVFIPTMITGPTGLGKTVIVEQIHAALKKPMMRVNITIETDEDSLMGGFRISNGSTWFEKGPVIKAMEEGATLLLDELDLISPAKGMCLQSVLEKGTYLIKKTGEFVKAKPGFKIVATANTKGQGDETGQYVATQILNAAMMDRFPIVIDAEYPDDKSEFNILKKLSDNLDIGMSDREINILIKWANTTRDDKESNMDLPYSISTRRLCDIVKVYSFKRDLENSVKMCLSRFDRASQESFYEMFKLVRDGDPNDPVANNPFSGKVRVRFGS